MKIMLVIAFLPIFHIKQIEYFACTFYGLKNAPQAQAYMNDERHCDGI